MPRASAIQDTIAVVSSGSEDAACIEQATGAGDVFGSRDAGDRTGRELVTMIARGDTTTRDRDFADVWLLTGHHQIGRQQLREAITVTTDHRGVSLAPLGDVLSRLAMDRQGNWRRYTARTGLDGEVPATLAEVIADVTAFVDPMLDISLDIDAFGNPTTHRWST